MADRIARRRAAVLLLFLPALLALVLSAGHSAPSAVARSLAIDHFEMTAEVARDGSVQVQETITARFEGSWNGLVRRIPMLANRPSGVETLGMMFQSATDPQGRPYRVAIQPLGSDRELRIFIPNASDSRQTVVLRYAVRHGVRFYPDHDELNWNVTGNGWTVPIQRVSARVLLPEGGRGVHASVYTGFRGARGRDAELRLESRQVTALSTRAFNPGEGLTLAVGFDKGLVRPRSFAQQVQLWLQGRLVLVVPVLTGLVLGGFWWLLGRDWPVGTVPVRYEPPSDLSPAVFEALVKQEVTGISLSATLVNLAVKGHLLIRNLPGVWLGRRTYRITLLTDPLHWQELAAEERHLLGVLFPFPQQAGWVDTEQLIYRFYVHVPVFQKLVRQATLQRGFFRVWPENVRMATFVVSLLAILACLAVGFNALPPHLQQLQRLTDPVLRLLAFAVTIVLVILFSWFMPRRTRQGVAALRQCLGFRDFLQRVESPRYKKVSLTAEMFERNLPYAMVAGLTSQWVAAFRGILLAPPQWYPSAPNERNFDFDRFGDLLSEFISRVGWVMQSTPESTNSFGGGSSSLGDSSSGSSGEGSSGGGDSGGGGGGF